MQQQTTVPVTEQPEAAYQAIPPDGTTTGVGLLEVGNYESDLRNLAPIASKITIASAFNRNVDGAAYYEEEFEGKNDRAGFLKVEADEQSAQTSEPELFDSSGMRAPYRQGPYDYHHDTHGRLIKKRWCKFPFTCFA